MKLLRTTWQSISSTEIQSVKSIIFASVRLVIFNYDFGKANNIRRLQKQSKQKKTENRFFNRENEKSPKKRDREREKILLTAAAAALFSQINVLINFMTNSLLEQ